MTENKTKRATQVNILGNEYHLVGENDSHLRLLAQYVDGQLRTYNDNGNSYSNESLAILTCLNIADQLYNQKKEYHLFAADMTESISTLLTKINRILDYIRQNDAVLKAKPQEAVTAQP